MNKRSLSYILYSVKAIENKDSSRTKNRIEDESTNTSNDSGSNISFELQFDEESEDVSDASIESIDTSDTAFSKEINKGGVGGVINNEQVYCSWEDVDARDEMATKLGTELCRFSMVSLCNYQKFDQITCV